MEPTKILLAAAVLVVLSGATALAGAVPASESDLLAPPALLPPTANEHLERATDLLAAGDAAGGHAAFDQYLEAAGLVPAWGAGPNDETTQWTYRMFPAGDVDGDGVDDIAFEGVCVDQDACLRGAVNPLQSRCFGSLPKKLRVVDGRTLEDHWVVTLNDPYAIRTPLDPPAQEVTVGSLLGCVYDSVVGAVPNDRGTYDFLVYRLIAQALPVPYNYYHHYFLIDGETGRVLWDYTKGLPPGVPSTSNPGQGAEEMGFAVGTTVVRNALLVPIFQSPPREGVSVLPHTTQTGLIVRSIGWIQYGQELSPPVVGYVGTISYRQPLEWAAGVNLRDGKELWKQDTLQPHDDRNVRVYSWHFPNYLTNLPCCFDLTGDGVPDLVLSTVEYYFTDLAQVPGALAGTATRVAAWDGAKGTKLWEFYAEPGSIRLYGHYLLALGDVNGDGASDFAVQTAYGERQGNAIIINEYATTVRSGRDASPLWEDRAPNLPSYVPLGDADGDGGNDLLSFRALSLDTFAEFTEVELTLLQGTTGKPLWTKTSTIPGLDLVSGFVNLFQNGLPDFDGDRVGDVWLDAPEFLPDQTVVHRGTWISGRDGQEILSMIGVGNFFFPIRAGDLGADGIDDFAVLSGDLVDLWVTAYDGATANPLFSRRVFTVQESSPFRVLPLMTLRSLELDGEPGRDLYLSIDMSITTFGGFTDKGGGFYQQIYAVRGTAGSLLWAIPEYEEGDASLLTGRPTPATAQYLLQTTGKDGSTPGLGADASAAAAEGPRKTLPWGPLGFGVAAAGSLVGAYLLAGRKLQK